MRDNPHLAVLSRSFWLSTVDEKLRGQERSVHPRRVRSVGRILDVFPPRHHPSGSVLVSPALPILMKFSILDFNSTRTVRND